MHEAVMRHSVNRYGAIPVYTSSSMNGGPRETSYAYEENGMLVVQSVTAQGQVLGPPQLVWPIGATIEIKWVTTRVETKVCGVNMVASTVRGNGSVLCRLRPRQHGASTVNVISERPDCAEGTLPLGGNAIQSTLDIPAAEDSKSECSRA